MLRLVLAMAAASVWCGGAAAQIAPGSAPRVTAPVVDDLPSLSIPPLSDVQRSAALRRTLGRSDVTAIGVPVVLTIQRPFDAPSNAGMGLSGLVLSRPVQNIAMFSTGGPQGGRIKLRLPSWASGQMLIDCATYGPNLDNVTWNSQGAQGVVPIVDQHAVFVVTVGTGGGQAIDIWANFDDRWWLQGCEIRRVQ